MRRLVAVAGLALLGAWLAAPASAGKPEPQGWVLVAVETEIKGPRPFPGPLPEDFGVFSIKGRDGGGEHESPMPRPKVALFRVPAGEYCVDRVRTYGKLKVSLCRDLETTRFTVGEGEFVNLGRWEVDVSFDVRGDIVYQVVNSWAHPRWTLDQALELLSAEQIAEVRAATPPVTGLDALPGTRWYLTTSNTTAQSLRFLGPDRKGRAVAAVHQLGSWGDEYEFEWRIEGEEVVLSNARKSIRARLIDGVLVGIERDLTDGVVTAWSEWKAGRDPFFPAGFETGPQPRLVGTRTLKIPADFPNPLPAGRVVARIKSPPAHYGRLGFRALWSPRVEEILESDPPGLYDALAKELIRTRYYTPAMVNGQGIEREWIETLEFPAVLRNVPLKRELPKPEASAKK